MGGAAQATSSLAGFYSIRIPLDHAANDGIDGRPGAAHTGDSVTVRLDFEIAYPAEALEVELAAAEPDAVRLQDLQVNEREGTLAATLQTAGRGSLKSELRFRLAAGGEGARRSRLFPLEWRLLRISGAEPGGGLGAAVNGEAALLEAGCLFSDSSGAEEGDDSLGSPAQDRDCDRNGFVNLEDEDVAWLARHLFIDGRSPISTAACDLNHDGRLDPGDLNRAARALMGLEEPLTVQRRQR
jgi:hypothetical protein